MIRKTHLVLWAVAAVSPLLAAGVSAAAPERQALAARAGATVTCRVGIDPEEVVPSEPEEVAMPEDGVVPDEVVPDDGPSDDVPDETLAASPDEEEVSD